MQLYHGTYLEVDNTGNFSVSIPENIFITSDFKKYQRNTNVFLIVPNKKKIEEIYTDEIQVCITPFSFDDFKNQYYFELRMNNVHGALSKFLELFSEEGINILECRAIDSVSKMEGKVELLATIDNDELTEQNVKGIQKELNKKYKKKIANDPRLINNSENIIIDKTNTDFIEKCEDKKYLYDKGDFLFHKKIDKPEYDVNLPRKILNGFKTDRKIFLGITYESKGNYILIKFKSINEIIVPIEIEFTSNNKGGLVQVIRPLSEIGVNLRLIVPRILSDKPIYEIYFNIENTKLKLYNKDTIEKILHGHIQSDAIEKFQIDRSFKFSEGTQSINVDFIKQSDKEFEAYIIKQIKEQWIKTLSNCQYKCIREKCTLSQNWHKTKEDVSNLVEQILNAKLNSDLIKNIPEKLYKIIEDENENCELKSEFVLLNQCLIKYIRENDNIDTDTKNADDKIDLSY